MTNRCKGKEFSAFIRQHVMLSTFGRSAISDKFAKLQNKVTFRVFPVLMKLQRPIPLVPFPRGREILFYGRREGKSPRLPYVYPFSPRPPICILINFTLTSTLDST